MFKFGGRLLEERKRLGLNQDQMAAAGNVAKRTYCNYEAGDREPGAGFLEAIAAAGADVQYILTGEKTALPAQSQEPGHAIAEPYGLTPKERTMLEKFRRLSPDGQGDIEDLAEKIEQVEAVKGKYAEGQRKAG